MNTQEINFDEKDDDRLCGDSYLAFFGDGDEVAAKSILETLRAEPIDSTVSSSGGLPLLYLVDETKPEKAEADECGVDDQSNTQSNGEDISLSKRIDLLKDELKDCDTTKEELSRQKLVQGLALTLELIESIIRTRKDQKDSKPLQGLLLLMETETHNHYIDYLKPSLLRSELAFMQIASGDPQCIAEGERLLREAVRLKPELQLNRHFQQRLALAYREMAVVRLEAKLTLLPEISSANNPGADSLVGARAAADREVQKVASLESHMMAAKQLFIEKGLADALPLFSKAVEEAEKIDQDALSTRQADIFERKQRLMRTIAEKDVRGGDTKELSMQLQRLCQDEEEAYRTFIYPDHVRINYALALIACGDGNHYNEAKKKLTETMSIRPQLQFTDDYKQSLMQAMQARIERRAEIGATPESDARDRMERGRIVANLDPKYDSITERSSVPEIDNEAELEPYLSDRVTEQVVTLGLLYLGYRVVRNRIGSRYTITRSPETEAEGKSSKDSDKPLSNPELPPASSDKIEGRPREIESNSNGDQAFKSEHITDSNTTVAESKDVESSMESARSSEKPTDGGSDTDRNAVSRTITKLDEILTRGATDSVTTRREYERRIFNYHTELHIFNNSNPRTLVGDNLWPLKFDHVTSPTDYLFDEWEKAWHSSASCDQTFSQLFDKAAHPVVERLVLEAYENFSSAKLNYVHSTELFEQSRMRIEDSVRDLARELQLDEKLLEVRITPEASGRTYFLGTGVIIISAEDLLNADDIETRRKLISNAVNEVYATKLQADLVKAMAHDLAFSVSEDAVREGKPWLTDTYCQSLSLEVSEERRRFVDLALVGWEQHAFSDKELREMETGLSELRKVYSEITAEHDRQKQRLDVLYKMSAWTPGRDLLAFEVALDRIRVSLRPGQTLSSHFQELYGKDAVTPDLKLKLDEYEKFTTPSRNDFELATELKDRLRELCAKELAEIATHRVANNGRPFYNSMTAGFLKYRLEMIGLSKTQGNASISNAMSVELASNSLRQSFGTDINLPGIEPISDRERQIIFSHGINRNFKGLVDICKTTDNSRLAAEAMAELLSASPNNLADMLIEIAESRCAAAEIALDVLVTQEHLPESVENRVRTLYAEQPGSTVSTSKLLDLDNGREFVAAFNKEVLAAEIDYKTLHQLRNSIQNLYVEIETSQSRLEELKLAHPNKLIEDHPQLKYELQRWRELNKLLDERMRQFDTAVEPQRARIESVLRQSAEKFKLPAPEFQINHSFDSPHARGEYSQGWGGIRLRADLLTSPELAHLAASIAYHEFVHHEQDVLIVRRLADKLGIGAEPNEIQLKDLRDLYGKELMLRDTQIVDDYLRKILRTREGQSLSLRESTRADQLLSSLRDLRNAAESVHNAEELDKKIQHLERLLSSQPERMPQRSTNESLLKYAQRIVYPIKLSSKAHAGLTALDAALGDGAIVAPEVLDAALRVELLTELAAAKEELRAFHKDAHSIYRARMHEIEGHAGGRNIRFASRQIAEERLRANLASEIMTSRLSINPASITDHKRVAEHLRMAVEGYAIERTLSPSEEKLVSRLADDLKADGARQLKLLVAQLQANPGKGTNAFVQQRFVYSEQPASYHAKPSGATAFSASAARVGHNFSPYERAPRTQSNDRKAGREFRLQPPTAGRRLRGAEAAGKSADAVSKGAAAMIIISGGLDIIDWLSK